MKATFAIARQGIDEGLHPGIQIYISCAGSTVVDEAFGLARGPAHPMTNQTRQLWMSATKPIAAIAILQQVERGKTTVDTRVAEMIPEFAKNGKDAITIRHILEHTAGFRGPLNSFTPGPWGSIIARCCALKQELGWIPGEKAGYHTAASWFILGELVRILDGRPFEHYVRQDVFARVGADRCSIGISMDEYDDSFALVSPEFSGNQLHDAFTIPRPGANGRGPIAELAGIYASLLAHNGKLLSPEMSKQMVSRQRVGMFDETFKQITDWGWGVKIDSKRYGVPETYGYGAHASDETFGHSGNQCSCAFADPKYDLVVTWCTNGMPGEPKHQKRQHAINTAIYEDLGLSR